MNREELIKTVTRITEIRARICELSALQKELKQLEALVDGVTGEPMAPSKRNSMSIETRVWQLLNANVGREWSAEEVASNLGIKIPTTRAAFSKLRKAGKITDTKRGHVRATEKSSEIENRRGLEVHAA
jgi:hypothetical protein